MTKGSGLLRNKYSIVGIGETEFSRNSGRTTRAMGSEAKKPMEHAAKMFQRARVMIEGDARTRLKSLPVLRQRDPSWALVRWLVPVR